MVEYLDSDGSELEEGAFYHLKITPLPVFLYRFNGKIGNQGAYFNRKGKRHPAILSHLDTRFYKKVEDSLAALKSTQHRITDEIGWVESQLEEDVKKSAQKAINEIISELIE
jgi:hypothetical protein